jgi:hypothetical protein
MQTSKNFYQVSDITITGAYLDSKNQFHLVFVATPESNYFSPGINLRLVSPDEAEVTFNRAPINDKSSIPTDHAAVLLSSLAAAGKQALVEKIQLNSEYADRPNKIIIFPFSGQKLFITDGKIRTLIFTRDK